MYKKRFHNIILIIPSFNELQSLKLFVKKLRKYFDLIIIDDCSTDNTNRWLLKNRIEFLRNTKNLGYEKSILKGLKHASKKKKYKFFISVDADGQHNFNDIFKIIKKHNLAKYDLIICNRFETNRFLETIISNLTSIKFDLKDVLSGFKIYNAQSLRKINLNNIGNKYLVDLVMQIYQKNNRIINFPVKTNKRRDKPRIGGNLMVNFKLLKILFFLIFFKKKFFLDTVSNKMT